MPAKAAKKEAHVIVGIHITERVEHAPEVQRVLSAFGNNIRTRLGLNDSKHAGAGLILLEMVGAEKKADEMMARLRKITGVGVKKIIFGH
jgi:hypothetical protein